MSLRQTTKIYIIQYHLHNSNKMNKYSTEIRNTPLKSGTLHYQEHQCIALPDSIIDYQNPLNLTSVQLHLRQSTTNLLKSTAHYSNPLHITSHHLLSTTRCIAVFCFSVAIINNDNII